MGGHSVREFPADRREPAGVEIEPHPGAGTAAHGEQAAKTEVSAVDLREVLVGFADWQGYGHGERAAAWLQRLEVNRPEIEAFRDAPTPSCPAYVPRAAQVEAAAGAGANESRLPADAREALARARSQSSLNAFTWLPDALSPAGSGLLAGVPVAIKDLMQVQGMPLTGGSKALGRDVATRDAAIVARLK